VNIPTQAKTGLEWATVAVFARPFLAPEFLTRALHLPDNWLSVSSVMSGSTYYIGR